MNRTLTPLALATSLLAACGGTVTEGPQPRLAVVGAASVDFASTLAGTTRARQVTLSNRASDGPTIEPLENIVIGINGAGLTVEHDCAATLASGAHCTITVVAAPATAGTIAGTLVVSSNAKASPLTLAVTGSAVATLTPSQAAFAWKTGVSGDFGNVAVGRTQSSGIVIENLGNASGAVTVALSNASAEWTFNDGCGGPIAIGGSCTFEVTLRPTSTGAKAAQLTLSDTYHQNYAPTRLALRGTGI